MNPSDWPRLLRSGRLGRVVVYEDVTTSTMEMAERQLARGAIAEGTEFLAGRKTLGPGTGERRWESTTPEGLWQTIVFDAPERSDKAPIVFLTGVAVSTFLRARHAIDAHPKWVNDVIVDGKKISGTLVRRLGDKYLVGVGLNVNQGAMAGEAGSVGVSMRMLTGEAHELAQVWVDLMDALNAEYDAPGSIVARMRAECRMLGRRVTAKHVVDGSTRAFTVLAIEDNGHLRVRDDEGVEQVWHSPDPWRFAADGY